MQFILLNNALDLAMVDGMNECIDRSMREMPEAWGFVEETQNVHNMPGQGHIFYPLLDYPEVDDTILNPRVLPLIAAALGGEENVRFQVSLCSQSTGQRRSILTVSLSLPQEFNIRVWPPGYGRGGMGVHHDAAVSNRYNRAPIEGHADGHSPPDYLQVFYYLTDVQAPETPAFCVVPGSNRYATLEEAHDALGDDYREQPISGAKGTCVIIDSSLFHTRLDGDGEQGRRLMHHTFARGGWLRTEGGGWREPATINNPHNLFPERLAAHDDAAVRRLFCLWSPTMCEFVASGFDPAYRSTDSRATFKGSPDPALRLFDERAGTRE